MDDSRRGADGPRQRSAKTKKEVHMPLYEHVFLARQDLAQTQVDGLAEAATKIIEDNGGKIAKVETWGLRNIAYRVRPSIQFDPGKEKVLGDSEASVLLTRDYRKPLLVPAIS